MAPTISLAVLDSGQDFFLRFFAEAIELSHQPFPARLAQRCDRSDAEFVMEHLDLLGPEPGDFQHLHQTRLH